MRFFRRPVWRFYSFWLTIALLFLPVLPAAKSASFPDPQNLRERFGTDSTAADFIFVVNTSSMLSDAGVFGELRTQLPQLLESLSPIDNFILVGFNAEAKALVSACPVSENTLPYQSAIFRTRNPRGPAGNLRTGLSAAMSALSRPGHAPLQFLFLILDGDIATSARGGPPPDSLSWEALTQAHAAWQRGSIAEVYALVVGDPAELQMTRMVFPEVHFVEASVASLRGFFERWRSELPTRKLRLQISHEISSEILIVQPVGRVEFPDHEKVTEMRVRLRSRLRKLSMTLPYIGEWSMFPAWLKVKPRYEDFPLTLAPGETRDLTVYLLRESSGAALGCWHWQRQEVTPAQISFTPAVSLVDHHAIRSLGVDGPSPFMHRLAVEIALHHGQPAALLWGVIATLSLMMISLILSRSFNITGNDFAVQFLRTQFARVQKRAASYVPEKLSLSENLKNDLTWLFSIPAISSLTFVVASLAALWVAERWGGRLGLGFAAVLLFAFWSIVITRQAGRMVKDNQAPAVSSRLREREMPVPSMVKSSLNALPEE
jgi:hypothetical protein